MTTRALIWSSLACILVVYTIMLVAIGYENRTALVVHFIRIVGTIASLILYIPVALQAFKEDPIPPRDYFLVGIGFILLGTVCFSVYNEAGRIWNIDTNVFTSPVSGLFSLFLVIGAFLVVKPSTTRVRPRVIAIVAGIILSIGLVFIAPLFR